MISNISDRVDLFLLSDQKNITLYERRFQNHTNLI
jgi:hypothetical protein